MEQYFFYGKILPERAPIDFQFARPYQHLASGRSVHAKVSIVLNQLAVWLDSETEWDIYDLRNVVINIVLNDLAIIGYLKGHAYAIEVTRIINQSRNIDFVFGIDIPCIAKQSQTINLYEEFCRIRDKTDSVNGVFLYRCFTDLVSSMTHAEDTGFYCYRAIESLCKHCAAVHGLLSNKEAHWEKFRQVSNVEKNTIMKIKEAADPVRHGGISVISANERTSLFTTTWQVVDAYLNTIEVT